MSRSVELMKEHVEGMVEAISLALEEEQADPTSVLMGVMDTAMLFQKTFVETVDNDRFAGEATKELGVWIVNTQHARDELERQTMSTKLIGGLMEALDQEGEEFDPSKLHTMKIGLPEGLGEVIASMVHVTCEHCGQEMSVAEMQSHKDECTGD